MQTSKLYREWLYQSNGTDNKRLKSLVDNMHDFDSILTGVLLQELPTGSGINGMWSVNIEYKRISKYKVVPTNVLCSNAWQVLNDNGFYVGWIPFTVSIPFVNGAHALDYDNFKLVAHDWKYYVVRRYWSDIKEYLEDTLVMSFDKLQERNNTL